MKTHYFQRYHSKENVDTNNAILLLSRLYLNSPSDFYNFLDILIEDRIPDFDAELKFNLQEKAKNSIPDAVICQDSFKIAVETKLYGNFSTQQIINHLEALKDYKYKILLTLDPNELNKSIQGDIDSEIKKYAKNQSIKITHIHLTFARLITMVRSVIDERDREMNSIIDDYESYCIDGGLIADAWRYMRAPLTSKSFDLNKKYGVYYQPVNRGYREHKYLGLYKDKAVRAIGELIVVCTISYDNDKLNIHYENVLNDKLNYEDIVKRITCAISTGKKLFNNFDENELRFFVVNKFEDTDFRKSTLRAPRGARTFDLLEELDRTSGRIKEKYKFNRAKCEENMQLVDVNAIAEMLKTIEWQ